MTPRHKKISQDNYVKTLKEGSLCRVTLPAYGGKFALGAVRSFQVLYYPGEKPYHIVWVEMLIEGHVRPFEPENLEALPRALNGFDQAFQFDLMKDAA